MATTSGKEHAPRSLWRLLLRTTGIIVVLILLGYLSVASGIIDRYAIPLISARIFGARLELRIDSFFPLKMRDIQLQQDQTAPLLKTESITVHFQHPHSGSRPIINNIDIHRPQFHFDARETTQHNYTFLQPYLRGGDSKESSFSWLPQKVSVDEIDIKVEMPEWSASISNINLATDIQSANHITTRISGDTVLAAWQTGHDWLNVPIPEGTVDANVTILPDAMDMKADILLPDFIKVKGKAAITLQPYIQVDMMLDSLQVDAPVFGELASQFSPIPIGYTNVRIEPFQLNMSMENKIPTVNNAASNIQITDLLVGTSDAPWYDGNLGITIQGEYEENSLSAWSATLNQGQQVSGTISTEESVIQVGATIKNWNRQDINALWPKAYAAWKVWLPDLRAINSTFDATYHEDTLNFHHTLSTSLPSETQMALDFSGNYNLADAGIDVAGTTSVGTGKGTLALKMQDTLSAMLSVDSIAASDVFSCLPWEALRPIKSNLTGKTSFSINGDNDFDFQVDAEAADPAYSNWALPQALGALALDCKGTLEQDFSIINAKGTLKLADNANVNVASCQYDIEKSRITSEFDSAIALTAVANAFGYDDLWGDITAAGKLILADWQQITVNPLRITSESFGYGDFSLPYGDELHIESPVQLDMTNFSISAGPSQITLGEGTTITADVVHITPERTITASAISLESDFSLLVAKQFLNDAEGKIMISIEDFVYGKDAIGGKIVYDCNAAHLMLPEKLADIQGLTAKGSATLPPTSENKGQIQIEELVVGGSKLRKTRGNILLGEQGVILEDVNFELFGGGVVARASVNIIGAEFSIAVSGEVQNLDLSLFTSEFEPPSLVLTGNVNGTFKSEFNTKQLLALDVDLTASNGFSMNRDMVEQLLMRQYVDEMTGGRQMTRVLQSVIGKDEQRKFDQARLILGLEDDRITGYAKLESENLNLTVDIKADPEALLEALKTRQQ
jgi:hypothetical protein